VRRAPSTVLAQQPSNASCRVHDAMGGVSIWGCWMKVEVRVKMGFLFGCQPSSPDRLQCVLQSVGSHPLNGKENPVRFRGNHRNPPVFRFDAHNRVASECLRE